MPSASATWKRSHAHATTTRRSGDLGISAVSETRKLAAILVADIVGYSRLAGADEDRILARLRTLRSDLIDPTIAVHHGRIVKRTGDDRPIHLAAPLAAFAALFHWTLCSKGGSERLPLDPQLLLSRGPPLGHVGAHVSPPSIGVGVRAFAAARYLPRAAIALSAQPIAAVRLAGVHFGS